jgi:hypothetical protein
LGLTQPIHSLACSFRHLSWMRIGDALPCVFSVFSRCMPLSTYKKIGHVSCLVSDHVYTVLAEYLKYRLSIIISLTFYILHCLLAEEIIFFWTGEGPEGSRASFHYPRWWYRLQKGSRERLSRGRE